MIVVAGFNTSIDKRVDLDRFAPGEVNRARVVEAYPGGKGLHVALTVAALGMPVALVGIVDREHAATLAAFLKTRGIVFHGIVVAAPLRTCLAIYETDGRVTELLEPGPQVSRESGDALITTFARLAGDANVAVLSGSLPPGMSDDTYARLVERVRARCVVDASGEALRLAVQARPFLVKPNRDEAERLTGAPVRDLAAAEKAAREIGAEVAVVSLGRDGAIAAGYGEAVHAAVELSDARHPVGSGDAMTAGLAVAFARDQSVADALRLGVACGAANARSRETGFVTRAQIDALLPRVTIQPRNRS